MVVLECTKRSMKGETANVGSQVDSWIVEEELPTRPTLKVVRAHDPNFGLTEDEIQERNEFISWYMVQDYLLLLLIPKQTSEQDFFIGDFSVTDEGYSAFNTVDFQRSMRPFDKYGYAIKMILERVKDLAILHSCISSGEGRSNIKRRYLGLVEREFRERVIKLASRYQVTADQERRLELKRKIAEQNMRILECKKIWEHYAPPG